MEAPVRVGQVVGEKYAIERIIARGGGGVVVRAMHLQLLEPCAIKFMLPEARFTPTARERFLREARACARLKSDHVVKVFDVGELDAETPYIVLEYLRGIDLAEHLDRCGSLPVSEAALYVLQMCSALAEAHGIGIVHRDLKPANVFLTRLADGTTRLKLLDFGISKVLGDPVGQDQALTVEGTLMGSPSFMAPEQVRGHAVDARADIWAVGVILYLLVTGHLPFHDELMVKTFANILGGEPRPPSEHVPTLPPALERVILACLEKAPEGRPADVGEIAAAIMPFVDLEAPLSLHVRRILESSADGRASRTLPSTRPATTTLQAAPVRRRWNMPVAIAVFGGIAVFVAVFALRSGAPSAERVARPASAGPAPAVATVALPTATAPGPPTPSHGKTVVVAPGSGRAASAAPPMSPVPPAFSQSDGFDLGHRR